MKKLIKLILVSLIVCGCTNQNTEVINKEKVYSVETINVEYQDVNEYLEYSGLIMNQEQERATFSTISTVKELYVEEGDKVSKGDLLMELDEDNNDSSIDVAYENMINAKDNVDTSKSDLEVSQLKYNKVIDERKNDTKYNDLKQRREAALTEKNKAQNEYDQASSAVKVEQDKLDSYKAELEAIKAEKTVVEEKITRLEGEIANAGGNDTTALQNELTLAKAELDAIKNRETTASDNVSNQQSVVNQTKSDVDYDSKKTNLDLKNSEYEAINVTYETYKADGDLDIAIAKNELDLNQTRYDNSKSIYDSSVETYQEAQDRKEDLKYYAKNNGTVLKIISKQGETVTPLAPAIVIGSHSLVAQFGINTQDSKKIKIDDTAIVSFAGDDYNGKVVKMSQIPDTDSRTYLTDILITDPINNAKLGEIAAVKIFLGEAPGIYLPINAILNDGLDYVYVAINGRAVRKNIKLGIINNNTVKVTGLQTDDQVIVKGMKNIKSGYEIKVNNND